jgi:hypothetical protein
MWLPDLSSSQPNDSIPWLAMAQLSVMPLSFYFGDTACIDPFLELGFVRPEDIPSAIFIRMG